MARLAEASSGFRMSSSIASERTTSFIFTPTSASDEG
jgi:hypothetical protein